MAREITKNEAKQYLDGLPYHSSIVVSSDTVTRTITRDDFKAYVEGLEQSLVNLALALAEALKK